MNLCGVDKLLSFSLTVVLKKKTAELAFKSSSLGIDTQAPISLTIPFIKTDVNGIEKIREAQYVFYINLNSQDVIFVLHYFLIF